MKRITYTTSMKTGLSTLSFKDGVYYIHHKDKLIMELREEELWDIVKRELRERKNLLNRRFWEAESGHLTGMAWAAKE